MRTQSAVKFTAVLVVIAILGYIVANGFNLLYGVPPIPSAKDSIKFGLDLRGGVSIVFKAQKANATADELSIIAEIMRRRLDGKGQFEATVTTDPNSGRIFIEIPNESDPKAAIEYLDQTAMLTFKDPDGKVVLTGADVKSAKYAYGSVTSGGAPVHYVSLEMNDSGKQKFADATKRLIGKPISIYLDDKLQIAPTVESAILDGTAVISPYASVEEATKVANLIQGGALPFGLDLLQEEYIGPQLGQEALNVSLIAGVIALCLIIIFMILYYRLPGFIASISLIAYTIVLILFFSISKLQLTLPGIAGVILTIGMAVDANVIIFERLKEELNNGKTLRAAIDAAFRRAFTAIFDANMTTILAGLVLWWLGTGTIQGFAVVLVVGVILSMFTALTLTRFLIKQFVDMDMVRSRWLYNAGLNVTKPVTPAKGGSKA